mmetsp:Transcript_100820/g.284359  ORF Transcript_100820/g.284359 Transcript_100820/m.284359 type:complete len:394 (-) Transcript_100820:46-1227(-)
MALGLRLQTQAAPQRPLELAVPSEVYHTTWPAASCDPRPRFFSLALVASEACRSPVLRCGCTKPQRANSSRGRSAGFVLRRAWSSPSHHPGSLLAWCLQTPSARYLCNSTPRCWELEASYSPDRLWPWRPLAVESRCLCSSLPLCLRTANSRCPGNSWSLRSLAAVACYPAPSLAVSRIRLRGWWRSGCRRAALPWSCGRRNTIRSNTGPSPPTRGSTRTHCCLAALGRTCLVASRRSSHLALSPWHSSSPALLPPLRQRPVETGTNSRRSEGTLQHLQAAASRSLGVVGWPRAPATARIPAAALVLETGTRTVLVACHPSPISRLVRCPVSQACPRAPEVRGGARAWKQCHSRKDGRKAMMWRRRRQRCHRQNCPMPWPLPLLNAAQSEPLA